MKRLMVTLALVAACGCSTSDYDRQFDASLQQYRADSAAGRKGRAVARPAVVDAAADGVPADAAAQPPGAPPGAPPGVPPGFAPPAAPQ